MSVDPDLVWPLHIQSQQRVRPSISPDRVPVTTRNVATPGNVSKKLAWIMLL